LFQLKVFLSIEEKKSWKLEERKEKKKKASG